MKERGYYRRRSEKVYRCHLSCLIAKPLLDLIIRDARRAYETRSAVVERILEAYYRTQEAEGEDEK